MVNTELTDPEHWVRHLREPVQFAEAVHALDRLGPTALVEVGPAPTLCGMALQVLDPRQILTVPSLRPGKTANEQLLSSLASLYEHGCLLNWEAVCRWGWPSARRRRMATYAFDRTRHWVTAPVPRPPAGDGSTALSGPSMPQVYVTEWQTLPEALRTPHHRGNWLLIDDGGNVTDALVERLRALGHFVSRITVTEFREGNSQCRRAELRATLATSPIPYSGVVFLAAGRGASVRAGPDAETAVARLDAAAADVLLPAIDLLQVLDATAGPLIRTWFVTRGAVAVRAMERGDPGQAMLAGFARCLSREQPDLRCYRVDLDPQAAADAAVEQVLDALTRDDEADTAYREGGRLGRRLRTLQTTTEPGAPVHRSACYLVIGTGGLGLLTARHLLDLGAGVVVVASRHAESRLDAEAIDRSFGTDAERVAVRDCDASDPRAVDRLIDEFDRPERPLRGVVHAAVELRDASFANVQWSDVCTVLAAKAGSAAALTARLRRCQHLDFLTYYSSATGVVGNVGQSAYGAASTFLDALAVAEHDLAPVVQSLAWGPWSDVGHLRSDKRTQRALQRIGMGSMTRAEGLQILDRLLGARPGALAVLTNDWHVWRRGSSRSEARTFAELISPSNGSESVGSGLSDTVTTLPDRLATLGPAEARSEAREKVAAVTADVLGAEVSTDASLAELGLDSLSAVQLRNALGSRFGVSLSVDVCLRFDTVDALSAHLLEQAMAVVPTLTSVGRPADD